MGNYIFKTDILSHELRVDAEDSKSSHDFGKDIIPKLFPRGNVFVYNLSNNVIDGEPKEVYWRDVGSVDAYWDAHMNLLKDNAPFSLMNVKWALHTFYPTTSTSTLLRYSPQPIYGFTIHDFSRLQY